MRHSEVQSSMFGAMTTTEILLSPETQKHFDLLLTAVPKRRGAKSPF
jgi:hypothetical protein